MTGSFSTHSLVLVAIFCLAAWRLVGRIRRLPERQRYSKPRLLATVILFPLILVAAAIARWNTPWVFESMVVGLVAGVALGFVGLRLTQFERTDAGLFYRPNAPLGAAIGLLFIARLLFGFATASVAVRHSPGGALLSVNSPLTLGLFATVAGYYTTFALGVLAWSTDVPVVEGSRNDSVDPSNA